MLYEVITQVAVLRGRMGVQHGTGQRNNPQEVFMPQVSEPLFHFHSQAAEPGTFEVVRFHGEEGLSQLYSFDILLVSQKTDVDLRSFLLQPATLVITGNQDYQFYVGILTSFEQLHQVGGWVFYRAVLRPKHWLLNQFHSNQIFLNQGLKEYLGVVLGSAGLSQGLDFDFRNNFV